MPGRGGQRLDRGEAGRDEQRELFVQRGARNEERVRGTGARRDESPRGLEVPHELILPVAAAAERGELRRAPAAALQPPRGVAHRCGVGGDVRHAETRRQGGVVEARVGVVRHEGRDDGNVGGGEGARRAIHRGRIEAGPARLLEGESREEEGRLRQRPAGDDRSHRHRSAVAGRLVLSTPDECQRRDPGD